jgi:hypothetical protein
MSKTKTKPPYLLPIENADQAKLLTELFQRAATNAPQAHILAAMWGHVERCGKYFAEAPPANGS